MRKLTLAALFLATAVLGTAQTYTFDIIGTYSGVVSNPNNAAKETWRSLSHCRNNLSVLEPTNREALLRRVTLFCMRNRRVAPAKRLNWLERSGGVNG